ncbi:MAG TPA: RHS repeat-associated core domain-containing protein [Actinokineospora sp.]|nr:RHS repeat-associated core domain-containing protein [Actinokineospora sp.]
MADAANIKWGFEFDFLGRQTARVDPDSGRSTTTYDLAGQVTSTTDALNQVLSYKYDELGRKIESWSGPVGSGGTKLASWVYDTALNGKGKLHSSTRHVSTGVDYTVKTTGYNGRGMPVDQIVTVPSALTGLAGDYKTQFGYTSTNLPTYVTPAHAGGLPGENIQFTYDRHGQPLTTRGTNMIVAASTYSSAGEPLRYALGGLDQVALTFGRDTHTHRVSQITMTAIKATPQIDDVVYTYDPAGNLTKAHNVQGASTKRTECFNYDGLARLTQAWTSATENACATTPAAGNVGGGVTPYWTTWEFNPVGSRTKQVQHQVSGGVTADTTTTYNPFVPPETGPRHAVKSTATTGPAGPPSTSYAYDAAGNTTNRTLPGVTQKLDWDPTGRLATVDLDPSTPATTDSGYIYDADGGQLVRTEPGKTTLYLPGQEIVRNTSTGAVTGTRYYSHNGMAIAVRNTGENPTYLKADMHGTNQVAVASNGYNVTRRTQDPYGNPLGTTNPWVDNRGFLNKPVNTTTGLTDIGARNYDPALGRFVSVDPILDMTNPQQWNGYSYANNSPTTLSDPSGLRPAGCEEDHISCAGGGNGHMAKDPVEQSRHENTRKNVRQQRAKSEWLKGNSPSTSETGDLWGIWYTYNDLATQPDAAPGEYWNLPDHFSDYGNRACFGRTACREAYRHLFYHPDDIDGAKYIAAFYCVENFEKCEGNSAGYESWSSFQRNFPYLLALGLGGLGRVGAVDDMAASESAVVEGLGSSSTYIDLTRGNSIRNIGTNVTHTEFAENLTNSGWASRMSKDGSVQIFVNGGAKYILRSKNSSGYPGWTADFTPTGSKGHTLEIRLGYTP